MTDEFEIIFDRFVSQPYAIRRRKSDAPTYAWFYTFDEALRALSQMVGHDQKIVLAQTYSVT